MKSEKNPKSIPEVETEMIMEASAELKEAVAEELDIDDPLTAEAEELIRKNTFPIGNGGLDLYKEDRDAS